MQIQENQDSAHSSRRKAIRGPHRSIGYPLGSGVIRAALSPRAGGLVLDVNINPGGYCNFSCAYCDVTRTAMPPGTQFDFTTLAAELTHALDFIRSGKISELPGFKSLTPEHLELRHIALSGDGEPTLAPNFREIVEAVMHVRALSRSFFKIVLLTNATQLHLPQVQQALEYFTSDDEVWTKLDAGSQHCLQEINGTSLPLQTLLKNIQLTAIRRPVVIQSLFASFSGLAPKPEVILDFVQRLLELRNSGAQISSVQIYSATRSDCGTNCTHLPLQSLSQIARTVREATGLKVEVF